MGPFYFSIEQISVGPLLRLLKRSPAKDFDERRRLNNWISRAYRSSIHPPGNLTWLFFCKTPIIVGAALMVMSDFHAANAVMDIARRPFHLRNRERCQEEDTLIRLGSLLPPLASSRAELRLFLRMTSLQISGIDHDRQGEDSEKNRLRAVCHSEGA